MNDRIRFAGSIFSLLTLAAIGGVAARAGTISLVFDTPDQTGAPGATLQYFGTLTNTGSDTVFLNGDTPNLTGAAGDFAINDLFFANAPISLGAGGSSGDIELFDVTVGDPFTDTLTTYAGLYTLLGGVDGGAQDVVTDPSAGFSVTVTSGTSGTPEPATPALLVTGLIAFAILRLKAVRLRVPPTITPK